MTRGMVLDVLGRIMAAWHTTDPAVVTRFEVNQLRAALGDLLVAAASYADAEATLRIEVAKSQPATPNESAP